jgi:hypothetical protein
MVAFQPANIALFLVIAVQAIQTACSIQFLVTAVVNWQAAAGCPVNYVKWITTAAGQ